MKYNTSEQVISCSKEKVYKVLSDFKNLDKISERIPEGVPRFSAVTSDRAELFLPMAGILVICFKEKVANEKLVLYNVTNPLPLQFELTMQLEEKGDNRTAFTLDLDIDVPPFVLAMIGEKRIKNRLDNMAHVFTLIPYDRLAE